MTDVRVGEQFEHKTGQRLFVIRMASDNFFGVIGVNAFNGFNVEG